MSCRPSRVAVTIARFGPDNGAMKPPLAWRRERAVMAGAFGSSRTEVVVAISEATDLGLTSTGFGATLLGAIVVSIASWVGEAVTGID